MEHAARVLTGTDGGKNVVGTKAAFTCDANYQMPEVGDAERTCQQDGTWSGTQPRCVGMSDGRMSYSKVKMPSHTLTL